MKLNLLGKVLLGAVAVHAVAGVVGYFNEEEAAPPPPVPEPLGPFSVPQWAAARAGNYPAFVALAYAAGVPSDRVTEAFNECRVIPFPPFSFQDLAMLRGLGIA